LIFKYCFYIKKVHELPFNKGIERVLTNVKMDDRRGKLSSMEYKKVSDLNELEEKSDILVYKYKDCGVLI
jgi:uncharacterized protein YqgV (UPF0045/DUF77 family)